jgi:hypothetical protein
MALAELNRTCHYWLNMAIDTINSIPLQDQKHRFITAFTEVVHRRTMNHHKEVLLFIKYYFVTLS